MKIGIVGWGVEGQSVFNFYGPEHDYLIVNEEPRSDFPAQTDKIKVQFINKPRIAGVTGNVSDISYLSGLESCDKVIYTPTSYKNLQKAFGDNQSFWAKTATALDIFFDTVQTPNIIGVTGTKGKGTTSTLIAKMLEAEGKTVHLGGNVGRSVLEFAKSAKPGDWVVLELSSFQLYKAARSPHIAVCLMIAKEHMDWHGDMDDYVEAKANVFRHQTDQDTAIFLPTDEYSRKIAGYSPGKKIPYYQKPGAFIRDDGMIVIGEEEAEIIHKSEVKLLGEHNLQNICAASTAVFEALGALDKAKSVLHSFSGLEHRLELVREFEGVKYYDDSFGTTPETAIVAIKAFKQPKVLILGGSDKGADFNGLSETVAGSGVRQVIAIGQTGPKIANALKVKGFNNITEGGQSMEQIVAAARSASQPGDVVLLSTGCASFGMFKDYKDRGNQFKQAVKELV
ncbi:MAG TPA: UDP-N-acetylmuramoyl-L-alanine--D-glutamate ligase [Candidatus Saccharimonadales bacterium]|nr:UDP-N-acetylmuramoyl-L-alanine--D-glutamate ligase [Candidatus Saccharimonadales bacterium]